MTPTVEPVRGGRTAPLSDARARVPRRTAHTLGARLQPALWMAILAAWVACGPVRLVSPYDEALDRGASDVYTRAVGFVEKMTNLAGKPEGAYAANVGFYS